MLAGSHFQQKVQMQPPLENMNNIKSEKKCENEVGRLQFPIIDSFESAVENPSFLRQTICTLANSLLKTVLSQVNR